ncbi:hypothetical protein FACS1894163_10230 [Spirochaetia bacterium]|nr:hypothetical protein FACS1894163_10230 [Spirochaetia bacterium]
MANINIRVDDGLKKQTEDIFSELGLSMSAATTVFYKQVVRYGGIPFDPRVTVSEAQRQKQIFRETYAAIQADPEKLGEEFDKVLAEGIKFRDVGFL